MEPISTFLLLLLTFASTSSPAVIKRTFVVSYIKGAPDGVTHNNILGINGTYPGPLIEGEVGDTLEVTIVNHLYDGQNVSIHWHGFFQRGTPFQDGASYITQCPLKAGKSQVYSMMLEYPGTYWYHSHVKAQYSAGLWGPIIIRGTPEVYASSYKKEILLTVSDWYHHTYLENEAFYMSNRSAGAHPLPASVLINGLGRYDCRVARKAGFHCNWALQKRPVYKVVPGHAYRFRLLSSAADISFNFTIDAHTLRAIEVDGVDLRHPVSADHVEIGPAQRYSFLLHTNASAEIGSRFLIRARVLPLSIFYLDDPPNINPFPQIRDRPEFATVTAVLEYVARDHHTTSNGVIPFTAEPFHYRELIRPKAPLVSKPLNERLLLPYDREIAPEIPDVSLNLLITFEDTHKDGIFHVSFNNTPFVLPNKGLPLLVQMLQNKKFAARSKVTELKYGEVVEVVVNNLLQGLHPMHLHGHNFFVVYKGASNSGFYDGDPSKIDIVSMKRDTVNVNANASVVIRFIADNPGLWAFHCHIEWHLMSGLLWNFAEAPEIVRGNISIPHSAADTCGEQGVFFNEGLLDSGDHYGEDFYTQIHHHYRHQQNPNQIHY